jgi:transcriptional regulator of arginine metabolism
MRIDERADRLNAIRAILASRKVGGQKTLLKLLEQSGFRITQATLSRDLKLLNIGKRPDGEGGYRLSIPQGQEEGQPVDSQLILRGFLSIEFSENLGVIKTLPGYANGIAYGLDRLEMGEILGTVAGDDTILVVKREGVSRQGLIRALIARLPAIRDRIG